MILVEVYRGAGEARGGGVVEPLLGSEACALVRGRMEMDVRAHVRARVRLTLLHRSDLRPGQLVRVVDPTAPAWLGKVVAVRHLLEGGKVLTRIDLDRPEV